MRAYLLVLSVAALSGIAAAQTFHCDFRNYKALEGIKAEAGQNALTLTWQGESKQQLRAQFALLNGQPIVEELSARDNGGRWISLGSHLTPDFQVTTGRRRMGSTEIEVLKGLKMDTPEIEEANKWWTFWDAPLAIPGTQRLAGGPRQAAEILQRASVAYKSNSCAVKTEGARVSVTFDGLTLGLFAGDLQFTVYKGSNLLRQEAIAKTDAPSVAYIYKAGLKGFAIKDDSKVTWRDTSQIWQENDFGGALNDEPVNVRARNRLEILDTGGGSLAVFPSPHKFFFARENEVNLGYVYYRKDNATSFSLGVMQPERGEGYAPWGVSDAEWKHRVNTSREEVENYALYNAPPGTMQRMAVYYYLSPKGDHDSQQAVLAYTHNDVFKPVPGFKVVSGHFHMDLNEMLRDRAHAGLPPQLGSGLPRHRHQYRLSRRLP